MVKQWNEIMNKDEVSNYQSGSSRLLMYTQIIVKGDTRQGVNEVI